MRACKKLLYSIVLAACLPAFAAEVTVYVSPDGKDSAKGASEADAVATLDRALNLAEKASAADLTQVRIALKPGTYRAQTATTRGHPDGVPILITSGTGGRAVFDGGGQGGTWLTLKQRGGGQPSNLKIIGLEVTNYETAIDVDGSRSNPAIWAGAMTIRDNRFSKIGDIARNGAPPSTAAIRLVNSDKNVIANNVFSNIKNSKRCGMLHAIYVAHGSTDNLIEGNTFEDSCGDAVRFRDQSDNNVVRGNQFSDAWARSPVSDWFCDATERGDCTKAQGECPSSNLRIEGNKISARGARPEAEFMPYGKEPPAKCNIPVGAKRAILQ